MFTSMDVGLYGIPKNKDPTAVDGLGFPLIEVMVVS